MSDTLANQWRQRMAGRSALCALLLAVPVAVAAQISFSAGLDNVPFGVSTLAAGPEASSIGPASATAPAQNLASAPAADGAAGGTATTVATGGGGGTATTTSITDDVSGGVIPPTGGGDGDDGGPGTGGPGDGGPTGGPTPPGPAPAPTPPAPEPPAAPQPIPGVTVPDVGNVVEQVTDPIDQATGGNLLPGD